MQAGGENEVGSVGDEATHHGVASAGALRHVHRRRELRDVRAPHPLAPPREQRSAVDRAEASDARQVERDQVHQPLAPARQRVILHGEGQHCDSRRRLVDGRWKSAEVAVASLGPEIEPCQPEQNQYDYRSGDNRRRPACWGWQGGGCPLGKEATGSELRLAQEVRSTNPAAGRVPRYRHASLGVLLPSCARKPILIAQCRRLTLSGLSADSPHQCPRLRRRLQLILPLQLSGEVFVGAHGGCPVTQTLQQEKQTTKCSLVGWRERSCTARRLFCTGAIALALPRRRQRPARLSRSLPYPAALLLQPALEIRGG